MAANSGERSSFFPAIEKKYGQPMTYWFAQLAELDGGKYPEQIALLREGHGFSQAHANAVVMFARGSSSSKRFTTIADYLKPFDSEKVETVETIFSTLTKKFPKSEVVIAWNQPMLKVQGEYVLGVAVLKNHILIAPWSKDVLKKFQSRLSGYKVNVKTIEVPTDWQVDKKLIIDLAAARIAEIN